MIEARHPVALESMAPEEAVRILNLFSEFITFMDSRGLLGPSLDNPLEPLPLPDFIGHFENLTSDEEPNTPKS